MNDFESGLAAALRAEAEEISMSIDQQRAAEELRTRLDSAGRRRRAWTVVGVLAATVIVVAGAATVVGAVRAREAVAPLPPAASVAPAPNFTSTSFGTPFSVRLPVWVTDFMGSPTAESIDWVTWNRCSTEFECLGLSYNRYTTIDRAGTFERVDAAGYLDYLRSLNNDGSITITQTVAATVDGRPATVLDIIPDITSETALGCHTDESCDGFIELVPGRYAVLADDAGVLVIWTRAGTVSADVAGWKPQFDQMLTTLRFSAPTSQPTS